MLPVRANTHITKARSERAPTHEMRAIQHCLHDSSDEGRAVERFCACVCLGRGEGGREREEEEEEEEEEERHYSG